MSLMVIHQLFVPEWKTATMYSRHQTRHLVSWGSSNRVDNLDPSLRRPWETPNKASLIRKTAGNTGDIRRIVDIKIPNFGHESWAKVVVSMDLLLVVESLWTSHVGDSFDLCQFYIDESWSIQASSAVASVVHYGVPSKTWWVVFQAFPWVEWSLK